MSRGEVAILLDTRFVQKIWCFNFHQGRHPHQVMSATTQAGSRVRSLEVDLIISDVNQSAICHKRGPNAVQSGGSLSTEERLDPK